MSRANAIFFISYDEENAEQNWRRLVALAPRAERVHGVDGILNAHLECARRSPTEHFFVVDGDNEVLPFDFDYRVNDPQAVHVWRCQNAVNDLVYGYGAIKLFPRSAFGGPSQKVDMSTGLAPKYRIVNELVSVTRFNTNPFSAWRSAFRECAKLASGVIPKHNAAENMARLETWCREGADRPFGEWCLTGAKLGRAYGESNRHDSAALAKINDFQWLAAKFREASDG